MRKSRNKGSLILVQVQSKTHVPPYFNAANAVFHIPRRKKTKNRTRCHKIVGGVGGRRSGQLRSIAATPRSILRLSSPWDVKDSIGSVEVGRNMCLRLYLHQTSVLPSMPTGHHLYPIIP